MATKVEIAKARVAEIEAKLKKARDQATALEAKINAREKLATRKETNQKKYLIGGCMMHFMEKDPKAHAAVMARLDQFLTRPLDRKRFGLEPLPEKPETTGESEAPVMVS